MIPVRTRWGLLAVGVLALGPAAARAGDDTLRLNLPGGPAATHASAPDATTRPLVLTTADEAETTPIGRGGGFHGGGFHGGAHAVGFHGGSFHGAHAVGFHGGGFHTGGIHSVGFHGGSFHNGF